MLQPRDPDGIRCVHLDETRERIRCVKAPCLHVAFQRAIRREISLDASPVRHAAVEIALRFHILDAEIVDVVVVVEIIDH